MARKLTDEDIKSWQKAVSEGFRDFAPELAAKPVPKPVQLTRKTPQAVANRIEARLDLHGLTLERAHKKFLEFIYVAAIDGLKRLLIITGKGAGNNGLIRAELPKWCTVDYIAPLISSCKQAELKHGGDGAFYVTLYK